MMRKDRADPLREKHRPETVWKLVESRCRQLSDAVAAARIPFLLALSWSFIWFWSIYAAGFSYISAQHERLESLRHAAAETSPSARAPFVHYCMRHFADLMEEGSKEAVAMDAGKLQHCAAEIEEQAKWARGARLDASLVTFPGGFARVTVADLAVIGELGLIIILAWSYFALRRENFAVRSIVDMDDATRLACGGVTGWLPGRFALVPKGRLLSAEHLAFAFHAVAQRFLFILTTRSRMLLAATLALAVFPAAVATLNWGTDLRDLVEDVLGYRRAALPFRAYVMVGIEVGLLALTWIITISTAKLIVETGVLLNGWALAVEKIWMEEWDERTDDPASPVVIEARTQRATKPTPADSVLYRLAGPS